MKKSYNILLIILLALFGFITSCDQSDSEPGQIIIFNEPSDGGGDDDEDPIIIRDTTNIN